MNEESTYRNMAEEQEIEVTGAREHNLANINVTIPRNELVVITGLSGSGKSSLAFDTIYAEGQRRYIETFSSYARQFLGSLERPDVDKITGLSPVISIEQKTVSRNPRSTVGTITEIYDFLRLLFARASDAFSYKTGEQMVRYSDQQITRLIMEQYDQQKLVFLAPVVKGRKGHYRDLFRQIRKQGFLRVRVDGHILEITEQMQVDRYKVHDIEMVIDRITVSKKQEKRIYQSIQSTLKHGKGIMMVQVHDQKQVRHFSRFLMCPTTGIAYDEPAPNLFSFNSPYGACHNCNGLGEVAEVDRNKILPDKKLSISKGGIAPLADTKSTRVFHILEAILEKEGLSLKTPTGDIPEAVMNLLLFGTNELITVKGKEGSGNYTTSFEGVVSYIMRFKENDSSKAAQRWAQSFMNKVVCPVCKGSRLRKEAVWFKIDGKNIAELASMDLAEMGNWFQNIEKRLNKKQRHIGKEVLKEIRARITFLLDVGLDYLTLHRSARTLSGGEAQRIRLATQIGSQLVGVLYILDEPSIGLHQRDNIRLINSLKQLRDGGNSVLVVEHDKEMIESADHVLDIGPRAGVHGGKIVAQGNPEEIRNSDSLTAQYLHGAITIGIPEKRRKGNGKKLILEKATGNNLKGVTLTLPLGKFICITGVSGSGKSTLINSTLYPILSQHLYRSVRKPMPYSKVKGLEHLDKVIEIDQSPIGRTPRSNPATYTGVFSDIRTLFTKMPEAQIRGYKPGRFSFNVKGGRCETCKGGGLRTIEMNFLPDVYVKCEACSSKRYNRETLEVRYKGKSISDVLDMTIDTAVAFFKEHPSILQKIRTLKDVGLGYITLGQSSTTLSGGEAQRVKLAGELSRRDTGKTIYILDEPTTGLHFEDIRILLEVLHRLVDGGNTILVIEHNMDIIKVADHIIDLGPEGGTRGGSIIAEGSPEQVAQSKTSHTARYLKQELSAT